MISRIFKLMLLFCAISVSTVYAQEICDNAIDDDNDGLIDINDDDCQCANFGGTTGNTSMIPNSSFEDMNCCPQGYSSSGSADYLNNCAESWIQASSPTSDYWHTCGAAGSSFDGGAALPPPDGNGFVGFIHMSGWQEYVGACLNETMVPSETYDLSFYIGYTNNSPGLDLTFYGTPNCNELPFTGNDCPLGQGNWIELGQVSVGGPMGWEQITVTLNPTTDINAIVMGGDCGTGGARQYYYMDDLTLNAIEEFEVLTVTQTGVYCENNIVLTATSDTVGGTFQWYKEGIAILGETSDTYNVPPGLAGVGTYACTYTLNDQCEVEFVEVVEGTQPTADFSFSLGCFPDGVDFTDQSAVTVGNFTDWSWDFGDTNTSTEQNPTHVYAAAGTYTVSLTVTTDANCTDTYETEVTVYPKPVANFTSQAACLGFPSLFTDQSTVAAPAVINQWEWDFGDLNTSTLQNPSNQYPAMNSYNIELIVTTADGCKDTIQSTIDVNPSPELDISAPIVCVDDDVQFVNNSTISSGTINLYEWDFGDNTTSNLVAPIHVYTTAGTHTVELIATSDEGCQTDTTFDLASDPNPVADLIVVNACFGDPVTLVDNSSVVAPGVLNQYQLDMGDLSPVQNSIPATYTYANAGSFNAQLLVTTTNGCSDIVDIPIDVYEMPIADFTYTDICENDSALFSDNSGIANGSISDWEWDFGNGNTFQGEQPSLQPYPADNTYPVSLIVYTGFGCSDTIVQDIEIFPVPIAEFTFDSVCFPNLIQFTDLSTENGAYPITGWDWNFSDTQTSDLQSPSMDFGAAGGYSAELEVTNAAGCTNSKTNGLAIVHALPQPEFPDDLAACFEDSVAFSDESMIIPITNDAIVSWNWDFGDLSNSTDQSPTHLYQAASIYNAQLTVESNKGCVASVTHPVEIYPRPVVDFATTPTVGCAPLEVQFTDETTIPQPYALGSWNWYLGSDSIISHAQNPFYTYDPDMLPTDIAIYDVGLTVTSMNGCDSEIFRPNHITVYPKPDALFSVDDDIKIIIDPKFEFTDLSSENVTSWNWDFGDGTISSIQHPVHEYLEEGTYPIVLIVETEYGCLDTIKYEVKVNPLFTFYIPNSFTPDENGVNDFFFGQGEGYTTYEMWVFDRWGEELFYSNDPKYKWDGSFKGEQVQQGTYVYRFYLLDWEGHDHKYKGHFTLHR